MKRGFLLNTQERGIGARSRDSQKTTPAVSTGTVPPGPQRSAGFDPRTGYLSSGNLTEAEKALPNDYDANREFDYKESDPRRTEFNNNIQLITSVPQPVPDDEIQCEWIVKGSTKAKVFRARDYPARIPTPHRLDLYELRQTADMGKGLFAKRDIRRGDLILAERPLLVYPRNISPLEDGIERYTLGQQKQVVMFEFEKVLATAFTRFPPESQADFRALHNSHTGDGSGPLFGIARTNGFGIDNLYDDSDTDARYIAICKVASRINHSCIPNVKSSFKLSSFSMQFYAMRDIKAGDQIFFSYCSAHGNVAERQAKLAPYGFVCKCTACVNATPETSELRNTFEARVDHFRYMFLTSEVTKPMLEDALKLEEAMVKEGLDMHVAFKSLIALIFAVYLKFGNMKDAERYGHLIGECPYDEE